MHELILHKEGHSLQVRFSPGALLRTPSCSCCPHPPPIPPPRLTVVPVSFQTFRPADITIYRLIYMYNYLVTNWFVKYFIF